MLLRTLLLTVFALGAGGHLAAQPPPEGSQLPADENACAMCHGEPDMWETDVLRLFISPDALAEDVHWQKGVNCHDCHGGDPTAFDPSGLHATEDGFRDLAEVKQACGLCHKDQAVDLVKGVHAKVGERDERDRGTPLECADCHGAVAHGLLPVGDSRSPVFLGNQVKTCGNCHPEDMKTYQGTAHGEGLINSGLSVTAVCSDCHGAHGIYYAADLRSTLHSTNVADTCRKCHTSVEERLQESVHGRGVGLGEVTELPAPGGKMKRKPSCTSCHLGHHLLRPGLSPFQQESVNRCGNCHPDLSSRYAMSLHGELTHLGYEPAAKCADCHGSHDILPVSDPHSPVAAGANRLATCRKCHLHAVQNFSQFDPHANHKDADNYPLLYFVCHGLRALFFAFFAFFVIHGFLWFVRSFISTLQGGGHKTLITGQFALVRFEPLHHVLYAILLASFLGLILTGLPLKYSTEHWAVSLARGLGGFETTSVWHHVFAGMAIFGCVAHLAWAVTKIAKLRKEKTGWRTIVFGPDSAVPNFRDAKDMFGMGRWFLGLGRRPVFERWTYWEKFDYWAVYLAAGVIGTSGLMLWYPNLFCMVLPGEALNVAKVIHSEVAILAASFLFMFHFYHTHFRPEKFPMDLSALTGLISEEHLQKHRPEYVERLRRAGKLDEIRRRAPSRRRLWVVFLAGAFVFSLGVCLLAVVLLAALGK